jgi:hypothetical protein
MANEQTAFFSMYAHDLKQIKLTLTLALIDWCVAFAADCTPHTASYVQLQIKSNRMKFYSQCDIIIINAQEIWLKYVGYHSDWRAHPHKRRSWQQWRQCGWHWCDVKQVLHMDDNDDEVLLLPVIVCFDKQRPFTNLMVRILQFPIIDPSQQYGIHWLRHLQWQSQRRTRFKAVNSSTTRVWDGSGKFLLTLLTDT